MKHLRVGKDKAKAVRAALAEERTETRLHSVPDLDETAADAATQETPSVSVEKTISQVTPPVEPGSTEARLSGVAPAASEAGAISPVEPSRTEGVAELLEDVRPVR